MTTEQEHFTDVLEAAAATLWDEARAAFNSVSCKGDDVDPHVHEIPVWENAPTRIKEMFRNDVQRSLQATMSLTEVVRDA